MTRKDQIRQAASYEDAYRRQVAGKITRDDNYATKDEFPSGVQNYVLHNGSPSYIYVPQGEDQIDFNILVSFGKKILDSEVRIDEDIQQFINDNFWDML